MSIGYESIESASIDELRHLQIERLTKSVKHAYDNVEHYRTSFDSAGVHPGDIKTLEISPDCCQAPLVQCVVSNGSPVVPTTC